MTSIPFVDLEQIELDHNVGHMLPREIAYRYHALPVASDGKQVTIVMAHPEDKDACRILKSLIHAPVFLIRAADNEIDHLLDQIWLQETHPMRFLFWSLAEDKSPALDFSKGIAENLGAELEQIESALDGKSFYDDLSCCLKKWKTDLPLN